MNRLLRLVLLFVVTLCQPAATGVAVTLPANGKTTLNATVAPGETYDREINWVSSNPAIAEIRRIGEQSRIGFVVCSGNTFASTTAVFDSLMAR
jgi:hypothetical protein